jgi:hypothetical protein
MFANVFGKATTKIIMDFFLPKELKATTSPPRSHPLGMNPRVIIALIARGTLRIFKMGWNSFIL